MCITGLLTVAEYNKRKSPVKLDTRAISINQNYTISINTTADVNPNKNKILAASMPQDKPLQPKMWLQNEEYQSALLRTRSGTRIRESLNKVLVAFSVRINFDRRKI